VFARNIVEDRWAALVVTERSGADVVEQLKGKDIIARLVGPGGMAALAADRVCLALIALACGAGAAAGCWPDVDLPANKGSLGGQVLISGPVRGARIRIDQLDRHTGEVQFHLGEMVSDEAGRYALETGLERGIFRITAHGGSFQDLATGATIQLDDTDGITSLIWYEILDLREDALASPIGHLVHARTMERLQVVGDLMTAFDETRASFHRHFGNVDWGQVIPWPLDQAAVSPTEPVRAAFVHAALSVLARDIAADAQAGPQAVNVYRLMQRWAEDVRAGPFDGNDSDDRTSGSGLQLGFCPPVDPACVAPSVDCTTGHCRRLCDLYSGTPRALLAGAMIKVINDNGPGGLNGTGLDLSNTLPIVRAVSDNVDPSLFDASCVEALDRMAPSLRFESPTPGEAAFVRGTIQVKAVATDDIDPEPDTSLIGFVDVDGDPRNAVALATIDTAALGDGPRVVVARAVDLTGNSTTLERALTVDNTAPLVTLDATGFYVDGSTWWTASAAPVLTGTISDVAPASIRAVFPGGPEVAGEISGTTWTIALPPGALEAGGTSVQIVATDAAGNQSSVIRRLRPDVEPPALSFQASTVNDEADEWVTFAPDHSPEHVHAGIPVDLATPTSCPTLTKFSYLLGSTSPEYALELPGPNPLRYQLVTDDPGVGIAAGSTEYRVGLRVGVMQTMWAMDWTSAGNGAPIGAGVTRFPVGIFSDVVAGLATTEGIYEVEFRATDRLGRTTTAARCFGLVLRAPPLELESTSTSQPTKDHAYALDSLSLAPGAQFDQIAARLLNHDATGASLFDQDVFNGTTSTIYLTVTVTRPVMVMAGQSYVLGNAPTQVVTPATCGDACIDAEEGPEHTSPIHWNEATTLHFPVKVFELVGGVLTAEIPCLAPCEPSDSVFKFAIPPRPSGGQPARAFRVMTMIGQVSALYPEHGEMVYPPFEDTAITWTNGSDVTTTTRFTGIVDYSNNPNRTGCVMRRFGVCTQEGTLVLYRALRSATLTFSNETRTTYATAATVSQLPAFAKESRRISTHGWTTSEGVLP
jgi:hypothetical protein